MRGGALKDSKRIQIDRVNETEDVGFGEAFWVWLKIGLLSFGGPAAQIAVMHRVLVDERRWMKESQYLSALNFCMLLPGPEAMQLVTYAGWRMHGVVGGLVAGLSFVLPGAVLMLGLAALYVLYGQLPAMEILFLGVKAAVLAIVIEALLKVSRRALKSSLHWFLAGASFLLLFVFNVPFPLIIVSAALIGAFVSNEAVGLEAAETATHARAPRVTFLETLKTVALWGAIWLGPIVALWVVLGGDHILVQLGVFFSKLAVVTFGGAYAVLAYMAQEVVENHSWLGPGEMLDGLGLAETTLGPLILVTEFVGFVAAFREGGSAAPLAMAFAGAVVTLWATFAPCFLWIFAGAPYVERLQEAVRLRAALAAVTAAVVGVILNLSVWFGLHVLFRDFSKVEAWPVSMDWPVLTSLDWRAGVLALLGAIVLFRFNAGVMVTLAICAIASFGLSLVS